MKLFDDFEAVRFKEENLIFITRFNGYIQYVGDPEKKIWEKYSDADYHKITVGNYQELSKDELTEAMSGVFPSKETDIMRLCDPSGLLHTDLTKLLKEDYPSFMENEPIRYAVGMFLLESSICHKSYLELRTLFNSADEEGWDNEKVLKKVKKLSYDFLGRDIFRKEICIIDDHDPTSYYWIMPARVIDYSNSNSLDCVAELRNAEISIADDDVSQYLRPFLLKHFDDNLKANKNRIDNEGNGIEYISGFNRYLTHNYYTFDSVVNIINDLKDTIDALSSGRETEYTIELRKKRGMATYLLVNAPKLTKEQIQRYNDTRPTVDNTPSDMIIDFYNRLIYRLEYMMKIGKEKGFDLISFMSP